MGKVNIVPIFGTEFTLFFPLVLLILFVSNVLDFYGKILRMIGLKQFQFSENFSDDRIDEGKKLLEDG